MEWTWDRRRPQSLTRRPHLQPRRTEGRAPGRFVADRRRFRRVRSFEPCARPLRVSMAALRRFMTESLRGKVVVVTGASSGVGRATVRELARRGATLGLFARGGLGLPGAQSVVDTGGAPAHALPTDPSDAAPV